ncbi:MAG: bifunctional riboflavin kinase/FAD synthetase [Micrococcales bacterium]
MLSWADTSEVPADFADTAVTIGKFDGVHLGHQALLNRVVDLAEDNLMASVVLTFDRHPDALLNPTVCKLPLIGPAQKKILLEEAGIDATLTLTFDEALAAMTPVEFVEQILVDVLKAKIVVVGEEFRFGSKGAGTIETLRELGSRFGFRVFVIPKVNIGGEPVSTTRIRALLDQGKVVAASALLGRNHITTGIIEHGLKIGRTIGFPTANMSRDCEGFLPLDGVYAGWLYVDDQKLPAAHSVGINETFQAVPRLVESFVLDRFDLDLYGKTVTLEYVEFIRPAAKFDGVESLVAEINRDIEKIRTVLELGEK